MNHAASQPQSLSQALSVFGDRGYLILRKAISEAEVDAFWSDVDANLQNNLNLTFSIQGDVIKNRAVRSGLVKNEMALRIIDLEQHSTQALDLMFHPGFIEILAAYYGGKPTALQTLAFKYGSQQGAHSDLHLVNPPTIAQHHLDESLVAAWIACENSTAQNGALVVYPGSHRFFKKPLSFFNNDYGAWVNYLDNLCKERGCEPEIFEAQKGDVLLWHGDLVHAGGKILNPMLTRKSFVVHYALQSEEDRGVSPAVRKREHERGWYFSS